MQESSWFSHTCDLRAIVAPIYLFGLTFRARSVVPQFPPLALLPHSVRIPMEVVY